MKVMSSFLWFCVGSTLSFGDWLQCLLFLPLAILATWNPDWLHEPIFKAKKDKSEQQ